MAAVKPEVVTTNVLLQLEQRFQVSSDNIIFPGITNTTQRYLMPISGHIHAKVNMAAMKSDVVITDGNKRAVLNANIIFSDIADAMEEYPLLISASIQGKCYMANMTLYIDTAKCIIISGFGPPY